MDRFSIRNNLSNIQNINGCSPATRRRLWQVFAKQYILGNKTPTVKYDIVEDILSYFGKEYEYNMNPFDHRNNCNILRSFIWDTCEWYKVYDFVEYHIRNNPETIYDYNEILNDEKTGFHIIDKKVTPITNTAEIAMIEEALERSPQHVAESLSKALTLFSSREKPDYNNTIKECITAVEALACTIVDGSEETCGKAISKFSEYGIELNEHLEVAIKSLYKYTCNEDGKRHGGTTYVESDIEDAKFMIITCSAIVNFLVVKWEKAKNNSSD